MSPSSPASLIAFGVFAVIAVVSALITVLSRNPIRNAMGLFGHVLALAGLYITLSGHFITAVQLIVYAGAVVVLFVFVIMMLGPGAVAPDDGRRRVSRAVGAGSMALAGLLIASVVVQLQPAREASPQGFGTLEQIGEQLFGPAVLPFELASVLLTVAVVGAFAVARSHQKKVSLTAADQTAKEPR